MNRICLIALCSMLVLRNLHAQFLNPGPEKVFDDESVHRVDIIISQDYLDLILMEENWYSDDEYSATFIFDQSDTLENVGFRLRGNTSRSSAKKSFKISFNTFEQGRDYEGIEKMNLNGEHNDPNIMRAKLVWDAARAGGLVAPRANYIDFYVNNEYKGLYLNVEHIDEEFVDSRFGNKEGNLYKCLWPADLNYLGDDPALYQFESGDRRTYDLKTNEDLDDYSDLAQLIDILNNTPDNELPEKLEEVLDVNTVLKTISLEILAGHWDSYTYLKNNYYLYNDPKSGKFQYLAYDTDNTLGIDWIGRDWATRDIYDWANHNEYRPLYERLIAIDEYKNRLSFFINEWIAGPFHPDALFGEIERLKTQIDASVQADAYRSYDWGFSYEDYLSAFDNALGGHVAYGLKPFISTRVTAAEEQLSLVNIAPIIWFAGLYQFALDEPMEFRMITEDETTVMTATVYYRVNEADWQTLSLVHQDGSETYSEQLNFPEGLNTFEYYFVAQDGQSNTSRYPIGSNLLLSLTPADQIALVINEFMPKNQQTLADEADEYDDWIELYNNGSEAIWLGDKYLSDKQDNPGKWQLPDVTLQAEEYLLIWADEDGNQGNSHANFKLSADGEHIRLSTGPESGHQVIDSVTYGVISADLSIGRIPNGDGPFLATGTPTPGNTNLYSEIPTGLHVSQAINWFPNPAKDAIYYQSNTPIIRIDIYDISGLLLRSTEKINDNRVIVEGLNPGIYLIASFDQQLNKSTHLIMIQ